MTEKAAGAIEIVGTTTVHSGFTKLLVAKIRLPDGRVINREIEDHGDAACVLPYDPIRKTAVLVRQSRVPVLYAAKQQHTLEAIAGGLEKTDANAAVCAEREAMEEAGMTLDSLEHVVTAWTMPGLSTELMHFYLALYSQAARPDSAGSADEDEDTVAVEIGLGELARMADNNALPDAKTLVLLQTLRLRRPDLF